MIDFRQLFDRFLHVDDVHTKSAGIEAEDQSGIKAEDQSMASIYSYYSVHKKMCYVLALQGWVDACKVSKEHKYRIQVLAIMSPPYLILNMIGEIISTEA